MTKLEFEMWLKKNGVLRAFFENVQNYNDYGIHIMGFTPQEIYDAIFIDNSYVMGAFTWKETPEGVKFWRDISIRFCQEVSGNW